MHKRRVVALKDPVAGGYGSQAKLIIDLIDHEVLPQVAAAFKDRLRNKAAGSGDRQYLSLPGSLYWHFVAGKPVDVPRDKGTYAIAVRVRVICRQQSVNKPIGDRAVLIEQDDPFAAYRFGPPDSCVQCGGGAEVFSILDEMKVRIRLGRAKWGEGLLRGAVVN